MPNAFSKNKSWKETDGSGKFAGFQLDVLSEKQKDKIILLINTKLWGTINRLTATPNSGSL